MVPAGNKAKHLLSVNHTAKNSSSSSSKRESFMTSELIILFMSVFLKIKFLPHDQNTEPWVMRTFFTKIFLNKFQRKSQRFSPNQKAVLKQCQFHCQGGSIGSPRLPTTFVGLKSYIMISSIIQRWQVMLDLKAVFLANGKWLSINFRQSFNYFPAITERWVNL